MKNGVTLTSGREPYRKKISIFYYLHDTASYEYNVLLSFYIYTDVIVKLYLQFNDCV